MGQDPGFSRLPWARTAWPSGQHGKPEMASKKMVCGGCFDAGLPIRAISSLTASMMCTARLGGEFQRERSAWRIRRPGTIKGHQGPSRFADRFVRKGIAPDLADAERCKRSILWRENMLYSIRASSCRWRPRAKNPPNFSETEISSESSCSPSPCDGSVAVWQASGDRDDRDDIETRGTL